MRLDNVIDELAAGQHSLIATWQLRALGATYNEVHRLRASERWEVVSERVSALAGVPWSHDRQHMAAVLDASPGASVAGESAAAMWSVPGYRPLDPVIVDRHCGMSRRGSSIARVREVVDLLPHHVKLVRGIPVISPARLICELAATQHAGRVERNLEFLIREGALDGGTFRRTVDELTGRGRKNSQLLRDLDAERGPGYLPHDSGTEMRFTEILKRDGQPPLLRQQQISHDEDWCGRVDFRDEDLPLIVEIQSEKYHSMLLDRASDARRRKALEAAGFTVLELWDYEVWHDAHAAVAKVRRERMRLRLLRTG